MLDESQLFYLKEVLGIDSVVWPKGLAVASESNLSSLNPWMREGSLENCRLIAVLPLSDTEARLNAEARDLVDKMIAAMKLSNQDVVFLSGPLSSSTFEPMFEATRLQASGRPCLIFGPSAFDSLTRSHGPLEPGSRLQIDDTSVFVTYSPFDLLKSPDLKRRAWVHLQAVMREL